MGAAAAFGLAAPIEHERRTSNAEHPTSNGRERWPGFGLRTGGEDAAITACGGTPQARHGLFLGLAIRWKEGETRSGRGRGSLMLFHDFLRSPRTRRLAILASIEREEKECEAGRYFSSVRRSMFNVQCSMFAFLFRGQASIHCQAGRMLMDGGTAGKGRRDSRVRMILRARA